MLDHRLSPDMMIYESNDLTRLASRLYALMRRSGYVHVQVPAIAPAELFTNKAGDQIIANLFTFDRFGKQLALRPEFTALAAYRYAHQHPDGDAVIRWQFSGSVFLDHYRQRNTNYQHMSVGAEFFGMTNTVFADAEILRLASRGVADIAEEAQVKLHVGHMGLTRSLFAQYQLDERVQRLVLNSVSGLADGSLSQEELLAHFDRLASHQANSAVDLSTLERTAVEADTHKMLDAMLDANQRGVTMGGRARRDIVERMLRKRYRSSQRDRFIDAVQHIQAWLRLQSTPEHVLASLREQTPATNVDAHQIIDRWESTLETAMHMGMDMAHIHLTPGLMRDWNYYTGMVFELRSSNGDNLGGGGRYDELVRLMGANQDVPAVGFVYNVDALLQHALEQKSSNRCWQLIVQDDCNYPSAATWVGILRERGLDVAVQDQRNLDDINVLLLEADSRVTYAGSTYELEDVSSLLAVIHAED